MRQMKKFLVVVLLIVLVGGMVGVIGLKGDDFYAIVTAGVWVFEPPSPSPRTMTSDYRWKSVVVSLYLY